MKNMNLKPKCKPSWHSFFSKNFIAIYIALALVLIINQIVFSVVLKDREKAKAFSSAWGPIIMTNLGNSTINAGATNALLAEFWIPDALFGSVTCDWSLAGNPCTVMADADGTATGGAGADDDGIQYVFNLEPNGVVPNCFFQISDGICTDSLSAPACIYVDSDLDCDATTGAQTYILGAGCGTPADIAVATSMATGVPIWLHSEIVNANVAYDYGASAALTETIWIIGSREDKLLNGSWPNINSAGLWQNDSWPAWNPIGAGNVNGEGYVDHNGLGFYDGTLPVIVDVDGDMKYANTSDTLIDADGTGSAGIGVDDDALAPGTPFKQIKFVENVCFNNFSYGMPLPTTIIYVDGNGDCIPGNGGVDIQIRNDIGPLIYTGAFPFTYFNAARFLVYADTDANNVWTYGAGSALTESLWLEDQGWSGFSPDVDTLLEADGVGTPGIGVDDDALPRGAGFNYLVPPDNICLGVNYIPFGGDFLPLGEDLYQDGNNDCIPGNGGADIILLDSTLDGLNPGTVWSGVWSSLTAIAAHAEIVPDGLYTFGAGAPASESLWATFWFAPLKHAYPSYTGGSDTEIYNGGIAVSGDNLVDLSTANGPSGSPMKYTDNDSSGGLTFFDALLEDNGNASTGPAGVPNGVIDRIAERINMMTVKNLGTLSNSSISSLKLYVDAGVILPTNGYCDNPVGSVDDLYVGDFTYDATNNQWLANFAGNSIPNFIRLCIAADIARGTTGGTIITSLPTLTDANANGLYDSGDNGLFYYSQNDGPVGGPITTPYTITIPSTSSSSGGSGGVIKDTTPPNMPINVQIVVSSSGAINITWTDPVDADLSQIVINEDYLGNSVSSVVNKGVQALNLAGRNIGGTYQYSIRALDSSGNYSPQLIYIVTIPSIGEIIIDQPLYLPAPFEPQVELPANINVGDVLKSTDSSALYYIGADGKKHLFPTENEYRSWYSDYSNVKTASTKDLNSILEGGNVYIRPGTYLIKASNSPKVYEVLPGAVLNWVTSERIAKELYGTKWQSRLIVLATLDKYKIGTDLKTIEYTNGHVISYYGNGKRYLIDENKKCQISTDVFTKSRYQDIFVSKNVDTNIKYEVGPAATVKDMVGYFEK